MKKGFWVVVKNIMRKADVILEILDARMTELTRIKRLEDYAAELNKPLILVVNKTDLASKAKIHAIKESYKGLDYVLVSSKKFKGIRELVRLIKSKVKAERIQVACIGYPNTGKSSLINILSKGGRAATSSESGFTRGIQFISGKGGLFLFDTPGIVPFEERDEIRLGLISGISPTKLEDPEIVAYELIKIFKENNPGALKEVYGLDTSLEPDEILIEFGKKYNMLIKGGIVDERRAAIKLLTDWHNGKIKI